MTLIKNKSSLVAIITNLKRNSRIASYLEANPPTPFGKVEEFQNQLPARVDPPPRNT